MVKNKILTKYVILTLLICSLIVLYLIITNLEYKIVVRDNTFIGIKDGIFKKKSDIVDFDIPYGVVSIGAFAFSSCDNLQSVNLPETVNSVDNYAFFECKKLQEIKLSSNLESIGDMSFYNCETLKYIELPNTLNEIGSSSFAECKNLKKIILPDSLESIGEFAFENCTNLREVKMSDSVSKVGENIFEGTEFINSLKPDEYGCIYLGNLLLKANDTKEYVKIKDSTKAIAAKAFINNIRIKNVDLPLGLIEIEDSTFEGCRTLESVIIPQGVKYLGEYAFLNSGLKRVVLPAGLEEISYGAFKDCYNLLEINLPSSIIDIKGGSFYGTKYLDSIKEDEYGCKYQENILLEYTGKSAEKIEIKAGTRLIAGSAFNNAESIKEVYIPKSVEHIGRYTFTKCHNLEKVEFEEDGKLTTVNGHSFDLCSNLKEIKLPKNIKTISEYAFFACGIETLRIPEKVEDMDLWAIAQCLSLKRIELPKSLKGKYYYPDYRPKIDLVFY